MRENSTLENFKNIRATEKALAEAEAAKIEKKVAIRENWLKNYHIKMDMKARTDAEHMQLMEAARDQALSTIIKAIYITALEAETLTDEGLLLAENMVDNWIKERGGASKILSTVEENTYLLNRIACLVEDTAEATVEEIEKDELDDVEASAKKDEAEDKAKEFIDSADKEEIKDFMNNLIDKIQDKAEDEGEKKEEESSEEAPAEEEKSEEEKPEESEEVVADLDIEVEAPEAAEEEKADSEEKADDTESKEEDKSDDDKSEESDDDKDSDEADSDVEEKEDKKDDEEKSEDSDEKEEKEEDDDKDDDDDDDEDKDDDDDEKEESEEKSEAEKSEEAPEDLEVEDIDKDGDISAEEIEKDTEEDLGEPLDDDNVGADTDLDGEIEDNKDDAENKLFDELEDEEDVQKAVELIRARVADAEETFIRNNAEDKKKMDEILNKISNNVKTVEDLADKDPAAVEAAKESAMYYKGKMNEVKFDRELTIFERMTRILTENIVKNDNVKDMYLNENGQLDVPLVVESAKVMYAFFETLNTIQIENVDADYITKALNEMKNEG